MEQMITQAIGGDQMDGFLRYVVNAVHCLKWCAVWATYDRKRKVTLKAKLIDDKLDKIGSSKQDKTARKKMERAYEENVTTRNQLLKLYNQVRSFSLHGPHLPSYQISLGQAYSWIPHGFRPMSVLPSDRAPFRSCWTWFAKITKKWSEDR